MAGPARLEAKRFHFHASRKSTVSSRQASGFSSLGQHTIAAQRHEAKGELCQSPCIHTNNAERICTRPSVTFFHFLRFPVEQGHVQARPVFLSLSHGIKTFCASAFFPRPSHALPHLDPPLFVGHMDQENKPASFRPDGISHRYWVGGTGIAASHSPPGLEVELTIRQVANQVPRSPIVSRQFRFLSCNGSLVRPGVQHSSRRSHFSLPRACDTPLQHIHPVVALPHSPAFHATHLHSILHKEGQQLS